MKPYTYLIVAVLAIFTFCKPVLSQVRTKIFKNGIPAERINSSVKNRLIVFDKPDGIEKIKREIFNALSTEYSNTFAHAIKTDLDFIEKAEVTLLKEYTYYSLTIKATNALNLSLVFNKFNLSPNAVLSIYNAHELTDSITAKENNETSAWAIRVYQGDSITLLLGLPNSEAGKTALNISIINYGLKAYGGSYFGSPGASATCNINVACAAGNGWENEQNSVAILLVNNGTGMCTGTLVMNTCNSNIPYVLTANHCLPGGSLTNWVFQYQYWSENCTPNSDWNEDIQFNGCTLRANNAETDFALVEMNQPPAAISGITYAGWDRTTNAATSGATLHHPEGDLMKVSLFNQVAISVPWLTGASNHWRVSFNQGIVQHGSSGAALFNQNHRIVGQLHGNQNNICLPGNNTCWCTTQIPSIGEYGRFDLSWTGGGTNSTRLSNWLDPSNTGVMTTNTTNVSSLTSTNYSISGSTSICTTSSYTIPNLPAGATITWSATPAGLVTINTPNANTTSLTKISDGNVTLLAVVNSTCGIDTVTKIIDIGKPVITQAGGTGAYSYYSIDPNGVDFPYGYNQICTGEQINVKIAAERASGVTWARTWAIPSNNNWSGNGTNLSFYLWGSNQEATFKATASNACGVDIAYFPSKSYNCGGDPGGDSCNHFVVYPNPASSVVNAEVPNVLPPCAQPIIGNKQPIKSTARSGTISRLRLYNQQMQQLREVKASKGSRKASVDVSGLPAGIYLLEITDGLFLEMHKLMVK